MITLTLTDAQAAAAWNALAEYIASGLGDENPYFERSVDAARAVFVQLDRHLDAARGG